MTHKVGHTKVSAIGDGGDTSLVRPSDWNQTHAMDWGFATPNVSTITAAMAGSGDSSYDKVALLLHCNSVDQSTTFLDNGYLSNVITSTVAVCRTQAGDSVAPKFGTAKAYLNGSDTTFIDATANAAFTIGTNTFTIEFWLRNALSKATQTIIDMRPTSTEGAYITLKLTSAGELIFRVSSADRITTSTGVISANTWQYVALTRTGGTTTLYVDGASVGTWADTTTYLVNANYGMRIGYNSMGTTGEGYLGWLDDIRFTNGAIRATTVPTIAAYDSFPGVNLVSGQNYSSAGPIVIDDTDVNIPNGSEWVIQ